MSSLNLSKKSSGTLGGGTVPPSSVLAIMNDSSNALGGQNQPPGSTLALVGQGVSGTSQSTYDITGYMLLDQTNQQTINGGPLTDFIDFNGNYSAANPTEGRIHWDNDSGTLSVDLPGGNVVLQVGQEQVIRVRNDESFTITNGKLVYISGSTGDKPNVKLASCAAYSTSFVLGMTTEDIASHQFGYVTTSGEIHDINTLGMSYGTPVWLSTSGNYTQTRPSAPNMSIFIGYPIRLSATVGSMNIRPTLVPRLSALSDTYGTPTVDDQAFLWNVSNSRFELKTISSLAASGTTNYLPKFTAGSTLNNSTVFDNGTYVGTTLPLNINVINEYSSGSGVTVDGLLIKDYGLYAPDGIVSSINGKDLVLEAGDPHATATADGGHVYIRGGNARSGDTDSSGGNIYLTPGNGYAAGSNLGVIYLGGAAYNSSNITLQATGTQTNVGFSLFQKGSGSLQLGNTAGYVYIGGVVAEIRTPTIYLGNAAADITMEPTDANATTGGWDLTIKGGAAYGVGTNGGNLYLYGGTPNGAGTRGKVYLGNGTSIGGLSARSSETNVVYYDTTTGLLTYGATPASTSYWQRNSTVLSPLTAGDTMEINLIESPDGVVGSKNGTNLTLSAGAAYDTTAVGGNVYIKTANSVGSGSAPGSIYVRGGIPAVGDVDGGFIYLSPGVPAGGTYATVCIGDSLNPATYAQLLAQGSSADVGMTINTKGAGILILKGGTGKQIRLDDLIVTTTATTTTLYASGYSHNLILKPSDAGASTIAANSYLRGGNSNASYPTGGDVFIQGGDPNSGGTRGNVYFGTGSAGYLPSKSSETNGIWYDSGTGKISYGLIHESTNFKITSEGGYAVKWTAGEALNQGECVYINQTDGLIYKTPTNGPMPVGFVYANASASASVWIVVSGIAYVLPDTDESITRGYVLTTSGEQAGRVDSQSGLPGSEHWQECGHALETSSGNGALTKAIIHFN